jgi:hypothetical protein
MSGRYEIRAQEPSDVAESYGIDYPLYAIWDTKLNKQVLFGIYRSYDRAAAHIQRMTQEIRGKALLLDPIIYVHTVAGRFSAAPRLSELVERFGWDGAIDTFREVRRFMEQLEQILEGH